MGSWAAEPDRAEPLQGREIKALDIPRPKELASQIARRSFLPIS